MKLIVGHKGACLPVSASLAVASWPVTKWSVESAECCQAKYLKLGDDALEVVDFLLLLVDHVLPYF